MDRRQHVAELVKVGEIFEQVTRQSDRFAHQADLMTEQISTLAK